MAALSQFFHHENLPSSDLFHLAASSPVPEPEPAPIGPNPASVVSSNLNLACQHGCPASSSAQQLNTNAALGSVVTPVSLFGGLVLSSGILAAI
ncbi:hypothetical protein EV363DRAFT_1462423 [Boletus edulis]|uniref:Uncharacterized protein n=1 Tax=Boletus edulis BED1 TaxID=1328754 RepID=A0AAD4G6G6_BOLED|nr:hypothetical protein EV363DRAFT_1462423 [Boletus edulis]KAF8418259.1 hypothetical protein L210DRAFT_3655762 [Boletus edulis BED1]